MSRPKKRSRVESDASVAPSPIKDVSGCDNDGRDVGNCPSSSDYSSIPTPAEDPVEQPTSMNTLPQLTFEQTYPEVTLPIERANIKLLIDGGKLNSVSYGWKTFSKPTEEELTAMKNVTEWEFRKHFIGLSTNKCVFQVIKATLPNVSLSSDVACEIHQHLLRKFDAWKFDLLSDRCYAWVLAHYRKHQSELDRIDATTKEGKQALKRFFEARTHSIPFKRLYGGANCRVLDVDLVFSDEYSNKLPSWHFRQVIPFLCAKTLPLVKSELQNNLTTGFDKGPCPWRARLPSDTKFVQDNDLRNYVSKCFDSLAAHKDFEDVELDIFPWKDYSDNSKHTLALAAKGAVSTFIEAEMIITTPPPPPGSAYPLKRDIGEDESDSELEDDDEPPSPT